MIVQAIKSVSAGMESSVNAESDQKKQVDMVKEWNVKLKPLMLDKAFDPSGLKAVNKELKSVTDVDSILEIFKKYNPNGQF